MQIDFAFLAGEAKTVNGFLEVSGGGFDFFFGPQAPFVYPHFSLVVRLFLSPGELGL